LIFRIPDDRGHMLLLLLIAQPPNWKQFSFLFLCLFSLLPIVLIIVIFLILFILTDHSLHYLHTSFERCRISPWISRLLLLLFVCRLLIFLALLLELVNIRIPDLPLRYLSAKIISDGWTGSCSSLFYRRIYCLNFSALIIKLVSHCLFDSFHIFSWSRLLLFRLSFDLLKLGLANVLNLLLHFVIIRWSMNIVSLKTKVHNELINRIIFLIFPVQIIIHDSVWFCQRVGYNKCLGNCQVKLCSGQSGILWNFLYRD